MADAFTRIAADYGVGDYFAYFGTRLVELAGVAAGMRVLDVAAGKGSSALPARAARSGS